MMNQTAAETFAPDDIQKTKGLAWLSYLGILFLIPMLVNQNSPYTKFHVNQGIVLFIADLILYVAVSIVSFILGFIPIIGIILSALLYLAVSIVILIFVILGIVNAVQGQAKELPVIGKFRILK